MFTMTTMIPITRHLRGHIGATAFKLTTCPIRMHNVQSLLLSGDGLTAITLVSTYYCAIKGLNSTRDTLFIESFSLRVAVFDRSALSSLLSMESDQQDSGEGAVSWLY